MKEGKITDASKKAIKKLLIDSFSITKSDSPDNLRWSTNSNLFFDLDKLWLRPGIFSETLKIVSRLINNQDIEFEIVGGITSNAGAYGTVPIATALAQKCKKTLITCAEMDFGDYYISPLTQDLEELFYRKKIFLIKDVLVGGNSLKRIGKRISDFGGEISGIFIFIDFKITDLTGYKGFTKNTVVLNPLTINCFEDFQG